MHTVDDFSPIFLFFSRAYFSPIIMFSTFLHSVAGGRGRNPKPFLTKPVVLTFLMFNRGSP